MKRILVLGSAHSSYEVVNQANHSGYYTIVASNVPGEASEIAREFVQIDISDKESLITFIKENNIDGVFTGPSEFLTKTMIDICEATGLRCYVTSEQWDICQNKRAFKDMCHEFGVPCVPDYKVTEEFLPEDMVKVQYPVIVKPVDSHSSRGIRVCQNEGELRKAIPYALEFSPSKQYLVEKYVNNDYGFTCRYLANDGNIYLNATSDVYTVDQSGGRAMISGLSIFPSKKTEEYIKDINDGVISMLKSIGLKNGSFFIQALVDKDSKIYFHEMGLRLSGGLIFKIYKSTCNYSDLEMMIRYAMEGHMFSDGDEKKIDPYFNGINTCSLTIPLKPGVISEVSGKEEILTSSNIVEFNQHYQIGDEILESHIGTLSQHFARIKFVAKSKDEILNTIHFIHNTLEVKDAIGGSQIYRKFDTNRINR